MLSIGKSAEWLELDNGHGQVHDKTSLAAFKAIAIFFYPKDFTPTCTAQVCHFRDHYEEIRSLGGIAFGISMDTGSQHDRFQQRYKLPYDLITDKNGELGRRFGVRRLWGLLWLKRVTFVLDSSLVIIDVIHDERNAAIHAERFIEILRSRH